MPSLDAYTLSVASAVAAFFMAVTMGGIYLAGNRERAIADWALAGLLFSLGCLIGNLSLVNGDAFEQRVLLALANGLVSAGFCMILVGVQRHIGRPSWGMPLFIAVGVMMILIFMLPSFHADTANRVTLLTAFQVGVSLLAIGFLWPDVDPELSPYRRAVAVVLAAYAGALILRMSYLLFVEAGGATPAGLFMLPAFLSSVLFFMALNMTLALLLFRRKEVHLRFLARHDALTGMLNRYSLEEYATGEVEAARRRHEPLSLVILDLDNFKDINDAFGHAVGDRVLKEIARRIDNAVREGDTAFRIGGEEFLVLLPGASLDRAREVAERLREALVDEPVDHPEEAIPVSASVGVVTFEGGSDDWERLLMRADEALYRAKDLGRNRVEVAAGAGFSA
jgi:diguanylate cyclase (GGDEF)-like protein